MKNLESFELNALALHTASKVISITKEDDNNGEEIWSATNDMDFIDKYSMPMFKIFGIKIGRVYIGNYLIRFNDCTRHYEVNTKFFDFADLPNDIQKNKLAEAMTAHKIFDLLKYSATNDNISKILYRREVTERNKAIDTNFNYYMTNDFDSATYTYFPIPLVPSLDYYEQYVKIMDEGITKLSSGKINVTEANKKYYQIINSNHKENSYENQLKK